jgi:hypothetical protein
VPAALAADKPAKSPEAASASNELEPAGYALEIQNGSIVRGVGRKDSEATLENVVDVLREKYTHANIVMAPGLAKLKISDLKLRALRLPEQLEAIRVASGGKFEWHGPGDGMIAGGGYLVPESTPVDPSTGLPVAAANEAVSPFNAGLFVLREPAPTPSTARMVEVFNLSPMIEKMLVKEIDLPAHLERFEQIIGETLKSLDPDASRSPIYQFHSGANLLVVIGTPVEIDVARKFVMALLGESDLPRPARYGASPAAYGFQKEQQKEQSEFQKRYGISQPQIDESGRAAAAGGLEVSEAAGPSPVDRQNKAQLKELAAHLEDFRKQLATNKQLAEAIRRAAEAVRKAGISNLLIDPSDPFPKTVDAVRPAARPDVPAPRVRPPAPDSPP